MARLGDMRGHKRIYVAGFAIFVTASALCGMAISVPMLVGSRAMQAVGAAMLFANAPANLTRTFPGSQRGQVLGLQGMMTYLGSTVGPLLGGWLAQSFSWRAVYLYQPAGGSHCLVVSAVFIWNDRRHSASQGNDSILPGAVTFSAGLILLLLGLNQGHDWGWTSLPTLACLAGSIALLAVFISIEQPVYLSHAGPDPIPQPDLHRQYHERNAKLHRDLQHHLSDAFLPDAGTRIRPRPGGSIPHCPTTRDGPHRACQRLAFGPHRFTHPFHSGHGHPGFWVYSCYQGSTPQRHPL